MIQDKEGFIDFIGALPVAATTKQTYCNWVRRIDEHLPEHLTPTSVQSEEDVRRLSDLMPKEVFTPNHIKDVRCIIRYYLKFGISKGVLLEQDIADSEGAFSSMDQNEGRKKVFRSIALRRGQRRFREGLMAIYKGRCCITGTDFEEVLEAAHIQPYAKAGANSPQNGILLRSDIHLLFDLFLLSIDPSTGTVYCSKQLRNIHIYATLHGKKATLPVKENERPDLDILRRHFETTKS